MEKNKIPVKYRNRYSKQILFPKIGVKGQRKLQKSKVLIVGCGGLGGVIADNLARAGIGHIKIIDRDYVESDNLQRQILFDEQDIGRPKALAAYDKLKKINSSIKIESEVCEVNHKNVERIIKPFNLILDGTDNVKTRLIINDACVKYSKPWIFGAAIGSTGMSMTILPEGPCYRCIIKKIPHQEVTLTCANCGILNTIPVVIGAFESTQALKFLINKNDANKKLIHINIWNGTFAKFDVQRLSDCPCCVKKEFKFLKGKGYKSKNKH